MKLMPHTRSQGPPRNLFTIKSSFSSSASEVSASSSSSFSHFTPAFNLAPKPSATIPHHLPVLVHLVLYPLFKWRTAPFTSRLPPVSPALLHPSPFRTSRMIGPCRFLPTSRRPSPIRASSMVVTTRMHPPTSIASLAFAAPSPLRVLISMLGTFRSSHSLSLVAQPSGSILSQQALSLLGQVFVMLS
ncbi:hypothetical protein Hdeb2414_s0004g00142271 [Helianthus debilis subsp. tardiflorus]